MEDAGITSWHFPSHFKPENGNDGPIVYSLCCVLWVLTAQRPQHMSASTQPQVHYATSVPQRRVVTILYKWPAYASQISPSGGDLGPNLIGPRDSFVPQESTSQTAYRSVKRFLQAGGCDTHAWWMRQMSHVAIITAATTSVAICRSQQQCILWLRLL